MYQVRMYGAGGGGGHGQNSVQDTVNTVEIAQEHDDDARADGGRRTDELLDATCGASELKE